MVNDVSRRIEAFNGTSAHAYSSAVVPPKVEQAARTGKLDVVQEFLDGGGNPNARTVYQSQLLHVAARHGQSDVLAALLKAPGIQVMALDYVGTLHSQLWHLLHLLLEGSTMCCQHPTTRTLCRGACGGPHCTGHASAATSGPSKPWWQLERTRR